MFNPKSCLLFCTLLLLVFTGCASTTFNQQGKVSAEVICYAQKCFTTVYWEDGSYSGVDNEFLPSVDIVYRICHITSDREIVCRPDVYETPILLFDKGSKEMSDGN